MSTIPAVKHAAAGLDAPTLAAAQAGDRSAQEILFKSLYPLLRKQIFFQLGAKRRELLEEILQESMMQIFASLPSFRGEAKLSTWALKIAIRKTRRYARKAANAATLALVDWEDYGFSSAPSTTASEVCTQLASIKPKKREAFILMELLDMTALEAGLALGVSANTAASRSRHAREELRATWKADRA